MVMDLENKVEELTQLIDELNTQIIDKEMKILNIGDNCYNLAKWLSHYLFYFSFSFLLVSQKIKHAEQLDKKVLMGLCKYL